MAKKDRGAVLVTGTSTGIGRATALRLADRGFDVFAGVRRKAHGEALAEAAAGKPGKLTPVLLDVTKERSIEAAARTISRRTGARGLRGLVNNAGVGYGGPLEFLPIQEWRDQLEVNLFGQIAVTKALIPVLRKGHGRIVFVGSVGGRVAFPFFGPYNASKFALEAVSDSLRMELAPWDIWVSIVEPGTISTPIWNKGNRTAARLREQMPKQAMRLYGDALDNIQGGFEGAQERGIPPEEVAKVIDRALTRRRPRARYPVGRDTRMAITAKTLLSARRMDALRTRSVKLPKRGSAR